MARAREVPVQIIFDNEQFEKIKAQVETLLGEISGAVEGLNEARLQIVQERKALAREIRRLEAAQRKTIRNN